MKTFNKLVRDLIPEIIKKNGETPLVTVLSEEQFKKALVEKLKEEVQEFQKDPSLEELADIFEVLDSIFTSFGFSRKELKLVQSKKRKTRGGFSKKLFLIKTTKP